MNQKTIREHNGNDYTVAEAAEWLKELDDRTKSSQTGYNSVDELAAKVKKNELTDHNGVKILSPTDATMYFNGVSTGAIKIILPSTDLHLKKLFIEVISHYANKSFSLIISFSAINQTVSCQIIGSNSTVNYAVRIGESGGKQCIYIGELNSTWNYLTVSVMKGIFSFSTVNPLNWITGWGMSLETSVFENVAQTLTNNLPVSH